MLPCCGVRRRSTLSRTTRYVPTTIVSFSLHFVGQYRGVLLRIGPKIAAMFFFDDRSCSDPRFCISGLPLA